MQHDKEIASRKRPVRSTMEELFFVPKFYRFSLVVVKPSCMITHFSN